MRALETFAESGDEALKRAILKAPGGSPPSPRSPRARAAEAK